MTVSGAIDRRRPGRALLGAVCLLVGSTLACQPAPNASAAPLVDLASTWEAVDAVVREHVAFHGLETHPLAVQPPRTLVDGGLMPPTDELPEALLRRWLADGLPIDLLNGDLLRIELQHEAGTTTATCFYNTTAESSDVDSCILRPRPKGGWRVIDYSHDGRYCF